MQPESPPDQQPPKLRRWTPGQIWTFVVVVLIPTIVGGGNLLSSLPKYEDGADWLKERFTQQDKKGESSTDGARIDTGSLGCVPEESSSAAYQMLGDGPYSTKKTNFAVLSGNRICKNGWIGRVESTPRYEEGTWIVSLLAPGGDVVLKSRSADWAHVREGNRVRYKGRIAEFSEQETIVVGDAELVEILKKPPPPPTSTKEWRLFGD